jgi:large conductance mechanosensitive channel
MDFVKDFKAFAMRGNMVDLAVGVIVGGAFSKIVDSVVGDLVLPLVSRIFGGLDFSSYYLPLSGQALGLPLYEARKLGAVFAYGNFLTVALNFVLLALIIFVMVRWVSRVLRKEAQASAAVSATVVEAAPAKELVVLQEIRDLLASRQ